jgi:hypothetical protein
VDRDATFAYGAPASCFLDLKGYRPQEYRRPGHVDGAAIEDIAAWIADQR